MIDRVIIDKILSKVDIAEVIRSNGIDLKRKGAYLFGCCPFHSEKTPSFAVYEQSGTYHCYGCGAHGNSVKFLMEYKHNTFPEAIKELGKMCQIEVKEEKDNPESAMEMQIKEAMYSANERLLKIYQEEFAKSKEVKSYAYTRWTQKFCELCGIGFCPPYAKLVDKAQISDTVEKALHLKGEKGYDVYSGRIVIPIRDWMQRIIGFTARRLDDEKPKYINSAETKDGQIGIFKKSESLFGIDRAFKAASKTHTLYIVEGAPDCMRLQSIGVYNAVAPLGTALCTPGTMSLMKRVAHRICFIPDADLPKREKGEKYGAGISTVMKYGEVAMKNGFSVTVKQIPVGEKKADPDSYCKTIQDFNALEEQDYILWMADWLFEDNMTTIQQGQVINRLATLMTYIEDDTTVSMIIEKLVKYAGKVSTWKKAVDAQRKQIKQEEAEKKAQQESDMYKMFGFNVEKRRMADGTVKPIYYYSIAENGGIYEWSNFTMQPLFHIKDTLNAKRIYHISNVFGANDLVELKQEDLVSLQKFKIRVESLGNYVWKATQRELDKLKQYLYEKTQTATEINQLGWNRQGFFAFGNGVMYENTWYPVDDYGIVNLGKIGNYYLPATSKIHRDEEEIYAFERKFIHLNLSKITLREFSNQIFKVFGDNGRIGFAFMLATLFKDIVIRKTRSFPILNIFGQKGSGKTELGITLMSFFIINNIPKNIHNSTPPALNETVSKVSNALVHIDEYKNDLPNIKAEFLKGLWDGTGRTRMNMDLDKKSETTKVNCGVILTGQEMPTVDIALFSRLIFLTFATDEFTDAQESEFNRLKKMRLQGMTHLTIELLKLREKVENTFESDYEQTMTDIKAKLGEQKIMDRIAQNWVIPLAVLRSLLPYIDTSLNYAQMLDVVVNGMIKQNDKCKLNNELAEFWNMVQYLVSEGEIIEGGDFRIEHRDYLKTDIVEKQWIQGKKVLMIQKSRIFILYKKFGKAVGDSMISEGSLRHYLENSQEYLGEKAGVRFKVYHKGIIQYADDGGIKKEATTVQRTYCFDYEKIAKTFKINLEKMPDTHTEEEKKEELPF